MLDPSTHGIDPVTTYVGAIRSVLLIDDQFPTLLDLPDDSEPRKFPQVERARSLYRMCRDQGWLCDIDNNVDPEKHKQRERIQACDLLVLDLQLDGEEMAPALKIVHDLARDESANLVVVYTGREHLDTALVRLAAHARGMEYGELEGGAELPEELEELEIQWKHADACAILQADNYSWQSTYQQVLRDQTKELPREHGLYQPYGKQLLLTWLHDTYAAPAASDVLPIDQIELAGGRWFRCGNLFLVLIQKTTADDGEIVLAGLKAAVCNWAPSRLACLIATSRRQIEVGSFRDDLNLPASALLAGLQRYIHEPKSDAGKSRRAKQISRYLLQQRFEHAAHVMVGALLDNALDAGASTTMERDQLLHLNAFLCSQAFEHHHVRVGTVFRAVNGSEYWACVTPACDMTPRPRNPTVDPWSAELEPTRPMLALRLARLTGKTETRNAISNATRARHVFFWDGEGGSAAPIVAASFNTTTDAPNPKLEQMFVSNRAEVSEKKCFDVQLVVKDTINGGVKLSELTCVAVSQLRAPYAERLVHMVGHHSSRIGVDFISSAKDEA